MGYNAGATSQPAGPWGLEPVSKPQKNRVLKSAKADFGQF